jgi:hypothetical protein
MFVTVGAVIECGEPPRRAETHIVLTGQSFLDVALYRCESHKVDEDSEITGAVCQLDGRWSDVPACPDSSLDHLLTPEHPEIPIS